MSADSSAPFVTSRSLSEHGPSAAGADGLWLGAGLAVELTVTVTVGGADGAWLDAGGVDGAWLGAALDEGLTCTHGDGAGGVVSWFEHPAIRTTAAVAVDNAATSVLMAFMTVFFLALGQSEMAGPLGQMLQRTPWRILGSARGKRARG